jgi:hypothetical protein
MVLGMRGSMRIRSVWCAAVLLPGLMAQTPESMRLYGAAHPYIDDRLSDLRVEVSGLGGLRPPATGMDLQQILSRTGEELQEQVPRIPDLIAQEDVGAERTISLGSGGGRSGYGGRAAATMPETSSGLYPQDWKRFEYTIEKEGGQNGGVTLVETRRDRAQRANSQFTRATGFGSLWLLLSSQHQRESRFKLLGMQKVAGRETYVIVFAQDPAIVESPGKLQVDSGEIPLLYQGVAWIEQTTFRIVRLRTDLLAPLRAVGVNQATSTIDFTDVRIAGFGPELWLPRQIEVLWQLKETPMGELHRYSNYRLFHATARILTDQP